MRASRLLQILLLLQNRGRMTSADLARELEVARRTILRDVDALTEAGLPMIVYPGHRGGIELGFEYRTRLTGLADDEAEAVGIVLSRPVGRLAGLGIAAAANRARRKLLESFPDQVRQRAYLGARRFRHASVLADGSPPRRPLTDERPDPGRGLRQDRRGRPSATLGATGRDGLAHPTGHPPAARAVADVLFDRPAPGG